MQTVEVDLEKRDPIMKRVQPKKYRIGIFIGRFCPIHLGHMRVIEQLLKDFGENHLILIGSCNSSWSLRNFFSYKDRKDFIKSLYPNVKLLGLPDYPEDDNIWFTHLIDSIERITGLEVDIPNIGWTDKPLFPSPKHGEVEPIFYGGCDEEIQFIQNRGFNFKIVERFGEASINVSSTEVRDCLIHNRDLKDKIHPLLIDKVKELFKYKWNEFRKV